jgi:hypothetical protein
VKDSGAAGAPLADGAAADRSSVSEDDDDTVDDRLDFEMLAILPS